MSIIQGRLHEWEVVIGLEVHAQLTSQTKLFSATPTFFGAPPNSQVSFIDAGFPGMLPVLNQDCVHKAIKTGLALKAKINLSSVFERKNYFYQDLPQGYQISQNEYPIVGAGQVSITLKDGHQKNIRITRLHLEQDAGKSIHDQSPTKTYVDLNRSGVALMEIVSEPDMRSAEEASLYIKKLRSILRYLQTCDGNMDQGSMRCDVNLSVRPIGQALGTRCEIKNVNSIKFVGQAIDYEARRQIELLEEGEKIIQETRLFDPQQGITRSMRSKEDAHDYRYFPDPDLFSLEIDSNTVVQIEKSLPELPDDKLKRFVDVLGLTPYDASVLIAEQEVAHYFEEAIDGLKPTKVVHWVTGPLFAFLKKQNLSITQSPISAIHLNQLIKLIEEDTISGRIAKDVFEEMTLTGKNPIDIVKEKGWQQLDNTQEVVTIICDILKENQDKVADYKAGKEKLFGFFVGQIMKKTQGKANPKLVNDLLKDALK